MTWSYETGIGEREEETKTSKYVSLVIIIIKAIDCSLTLLFELG